MIGSVVRSTLLVGTIVCAYALGRKHNGAITLKIWSASFNMKAKEIVGDILSSAGECYIKLNEELGMFDARKDEHASAGDELREFVRAQMLKRIDDAHTTLNHIQTVYDEYKSSPSVE